MSALARRVDVPFDAPDEEGEEAGEPRTQPAGATPRPTKAPGSLRQDKRGPVTRRYGLVSRTSAFAFKGKNADIRKIGEQLGVTTVLEGSVRKAGNRLRVTAQLVSVTDGYHLWSDRYDRQLDDVFAIQDEIAENIVRALRVVLSEKEKRWEMRPPKHTAGHTEAVTTTSI